MILKIKCNKQFSNIDVDLSISPLVIHFEEENDSNKNMETKRIKKHIDERRKERMKLEYLILKSRYE